MPPRLAGRDRHCLEHDVWLVEGGRGRFLTSILSQPISDSSDTLRFDEGCMRPADRTFGASRAVLARVCAQRSRGILWEPDRTLLIDNWRTLHAREATVANDTERVLERVMVTTE